MAVRFDRGSFVAKKPALPRTIEGVVARIHEPGDALEYSSGPEHRDLAELTRLVGQLKGLPVVSGKEIDSTSPPGHPEDLIAKGAEFVQIGVVLDGRVEDGKAIATIYFHDQAALDAIDDGIKELSLGYSCQLDSERFQRNIQLDHLSIVPRARCGAACALRTDASEAPCACQFAKSVPSATLGSVSAGTIEIAAKIVLDNESKQLLADIKKLDAACKKKDATCKKKDETTGMGCTCPDGEMDPNCTCSCHDGQHGTMDETRSAAVVETPCGCKDRTKMLNNEESTMDAAELQKKLDEALAEIATLKAGAEKAELELNQAKADLKSETARADKLAEDVAAVKADAQAKVDAATAARTDAEDKAFFAAVDARVELLADAGKVGVETFKLDGDKKVPLTDREVKIAIVKKVDGMDVETDRSADYVNGMYAGAMRRHSKAAASLAEVRTAIVENHDQAVEAATTSDISATEEAARKAAAAKRNGRWR